MNIESCIGIEITIEVDDGLRLAKEMKIRIRNRKISEEKIEKEVKK